jgi:hypothetical protein
VLVVMLDQFPVSEKTEVVKAEDIGLLLPGLDDI